MHTAVANANFVIYSDMANYFSIISIGLLTKSGEPLARTAILAVSSRFWASIVAVAVLQTVAVEGEESRVVLDVRLPHRPVIMYAAIIKLKSRHETSISRFAVIVSCFAILISRFAMRMVWPSAVFAWVGHRVEAGAVRIEGIAAPSTHSRVGTDPIAVPSARRCQVVGTIAVITPYYIYSVALMAQFRTLIAEMLSKNCTKVALCAQFA